LKKTTGSILGRPRSAYNSRVHSRTKLRSSVPSRMPVEVVGGDQVLQ
jgi:hypothetical protein